MKKIIDYAHDVGADGKGLAALVVDAGMLKAQVEIAYPVAKLMEPILKPLDSLGAKIKDLIPGDYEVSLVDGAIADAKAAIIKLLSE